MRRSGTPSTKSVYVTHSDFVRKVSDIKSDFVIHYVTTGKEINCQPLTLGIKPTFDGAWRVAGDQHQHYF